MKDLFPDLDLYGIILELLFINNNHFIYRFNDAIFVES